MPRSCSCSTARSATWWASCWACWNSATPASWREVTHTIKGAARGVGAFAMGEAAADAEPVDPVTNPDRAIEVIEALRVEGEAVQAFIADIWPA